MRAALERVREHDAELTALDRLRHEGSREDRYFWHKGRKVNAAVIHADPKQRLLMFLELRAKGKPT